MALIKHDEGKDVVLSRILGARCLNGGMYNGSGDRTADFEIILRAASLSDDAVTELDARLTAGESPQQVLDSCKVQNGVFDATRGCEMYDGEWRE